MSNSYQVRTTIVVDRPELRGPTYPVVRAGHRIQWTQTYASQGAAVRAAASILRGGEDHSSEFVGVVEVLHVRPMRGPRVVRRRVERDRGETTREQREQLLRVGAARRGNFLTIYCADGRQR